MPEILVECTATHNAGDCHGVWIDSTQDAEDIAKEIQAMLKSSPHPNAEEWFINDFDGFEEFDFSSNTALEDISTISNLVEEHGEAIAHFYDDAGTISLDSVGDAFKKAYVGEFNSFEEFAVESFLNQHSGTFPILPKVLDHSKVADIYEEQYSHYTLTDGYVVVFRNDW